MPTLIDALRIMGQAGWARDVGAHLSLCRSLAGDGELLASIVNVPGAGGKLRLQHAALTGNLARLRVLIAAGARTRSFAALEELARGGVALPRAVALMGAFSDDAAVVALAVRALGRKAYDEEKCEALIEAGAVAALVAVVRKSYATCYNVVVFELLLRAFDFFLLSRCGREYFDDFFSPLFLLAGLPMAQMSSNSARHLVSAIHSLALDEDNLDDLIDYEAPSVLTGLLRQPSITSCALAAAAACKCLSALASSEFGCEVCLEAEAPAALAALAGTPLALGSADLAAQIASALFVLMSSEDGDEGIDVSALAALVAFVRQPPIQKNEYAMYCVACVLAKATESDIGAEDCVEAGIASALIALAVGLPAAYDCAATLDKIVLAIYNISRFEAGAESLLEAGASDALVALATTMFSASTVIGVAGALGFLFLRAAADSDGQDVLLEAKAPAALVWLTGYTAVQLSAPSIDRIAWAIMAFSCSDDGMQACVNAGAKAALQMFASLPALEEDAAARAQVARTLLCFK